MVGGKAFGVIIFTSILLLVYLVPISVEALEESLGEWSDSIKISSSVLVLADIWENTLYGYQSGGLVISHDGGDTWSSPIEFDGRIDAAGNVLYRVDESMFFSKSTDNGSTWSPLVKVYTLDTWHDGAYGIFMHNSQLFVYSIDGAGLGSGHIRLSKSIDFGTTWSTPITIDPNVHLTDPLPNDLIYSNDKLFMAYWHYGYDPISMEEIPEIIIIESSDWGDHWIDRRVIAQNGFQPLIKADSGLLYITYIGANSDGLELFFTKSSDGDTWSTPVKIGHITDGNDPVNVHSLAVSSGNIFASYLDYHETGEKYYIHINYSADNGATWQDLDDVTGRDTNAMYPSLLIGENKLHFCWVDTGTGGWTDSGETYYRYLVLEETTDDTSNGIEGSGDSLLLLGILVAVVAIAAISVFYIIRKKKPPIVSQ